MKHDKNHDNGRVTGRHLVPVHFEFTHPAAVTVRIGGTFNDWRPEAKPMHPMWNGRCLKERACRPAPANIAWPWTGDGYPIHWSKKSGPIRSGEELRSYGGQRT